jgi:hypothetical protein
MLSSAARSRCQRDCATTNSSYSAPFTGLSTRKHLQPDGFSLRQNGHEDQDENGVALVRSDPHHCD